MVLWNFGMSQWHPSVENLENTISEDTEENSNIYLSNMGAFFMYCELQFWPHTKF